MPQNTFNILTPSTETSVPKYSTIAVTTSSAIVTAVAGKKIRVLAFVLSPDGTAGVNVKFQSNAGGTDITGLLYLTTSSTIIGSFNPAGWFETTAGQDVYLNVSAATTLGGQLVYIETDN